MTCLPSMQRKEGEFCRILQLQSCNLLMIDLDKLKLLAQGGQAKIYELDEHKVLRVLRYRNDDENLRCEMSVMNALHARGKAVPKVYEYLLIDEKPSVIMERLNGESMVEEMKRNPKAIFKNAKKLAELHLEITGPADDLPIMSIHKRAAYLIPRAELLSKEIIAFALDILSELPEGNDICHGDFHPGNIIVSDGVYYVIDWFGVTSGRKLSDIAHTYLLCRNTPKLPSEGKVMNFVSDIAGSFISKRYLKTCFRLSSFDHAEFSRWLVIRAAERVTYGMPSEKPALIVFLNKCMNARRKGVPPERWWKYI